MVLPDPVSARDRLRQGVTAAAAFAQALVASLTTIAEPGGVAGAGTSALPLMPASHAFVIWVPVVAWCLAHAFWQALPRNADDPLARRAGWLFAGAMAGTALWTGIAGASATPAPLLATLLLAVTAAAATAALHQADTWHGPLRRDQRWLFAAPLALLAGWVSVLAFVALASALSGLGIGSFGDAGAAASPALIALMTATALAVIARLQPFPTYALAVVWALVAVLARNGGNAIGITAAAAALLVALLAVRRYRTP